MTKAESMRGVIEPNEYAFQSLVSKTDLSLCSGDWVPKVQSVEASLTHESQLIMHSDPYSMAADRFRTLRVHLRRLGHAVKLKVLMVTSARAAEGKSFTALNLAASLAEQKGSVVVLVEADLRRSALSRRLGLKPWPGLAQCLEQASDPQTQIRKVQPLGFHLLPAGEPTPSPMRLLNSDGFSKMFQQLRSAADWVIVDCPPVYPVPDALVIRGNADGCLWVVRANVTPREVVREGMDLFGKELVVGMVLNGAEPDHTSYYSHYAPGSRSEPWVEESGPLKLLTR